MAVAIIENLFVLDEMKEGKEQLPKRNFTAYSQCQESLFFSAQIVKSTIVQLPFKKIN